MDLHETYYYNAKRAVEELFSDKSVSQEQTRKSLQTLIYEIEEMMETLTEDEL